MKYLILFENIFLPPPAARPPSPALYIVLRYPHHIPRLSTENPQVLSLVRPLENAQPGPILVPINTAILGETHERNSL